MSLYDTPRHATPGTCRGDLHAIVISAAYSTIRDSTADLDSTYTRLKFKFTDAALYNSHLGDGMVRIVLTFMLVGSGSKGKQ